MNILEKLKFEWNQKQALSWSKLVPANFDQLLTVRQTHFMVILMVLKCTLLSHTTKHWVNKVLDVKPLVPLSTRSLTNIVTKIVL